MHYLGIWDLWLGKLTRPGPGCFCHSYRRYREFTRPRALTDRIDVILRTADPGAALASVFGWPYSRKATVASRNDYDAKRYRLRRLIPSSW